MTQRRIGKSSEIRRSGGQGFSPLFTWVLILVSLQTLLLGAIFLRVYDLIPEFDNAVITEDYLNEMESGGTEEPESQTDQQVASIPEVSEEKDSKPIRVEVLNGCGVAGIARRTADFLINKGYDVRDYKNADRRNYRNTKIYVRSDNRADGEALAKTIALPDQYVILEPNPELVDVDVSLLLGRDHNQYILPP
jgi:hypothetical protein